MMTPNSMASRQRGIVLITSLLLLIVVTLIALSSFRSMGVQERIAGNTREKQRALQAAVSTQQYAEWWLANKSNAPIAVSATQAASIDITCNSVRVANTTASATAPQICLNSLAQAGQTVSTLPWTVGVSYAPSGMTVKSGTCTSECYWNTPMFYIADAGPYGRMGELYQVDAYSFGTTPSTVAVVESTVAVTCIVCNPGTI